MKFRTECIPDPAGLRLSPEKPVICVGSCFAQNISQRMQSCQWDAANPLGVLFNPFSIQKALELCIFNANADEIFRKSLFRDREVYHSRLFDSSFSSYSEDECVAKFQKAQRRLLECLHSGQTLIITFGTAYCYFHVDSPDEIVANCHKQPESCFVRRRVRVEEITVKWDEFAPRLKERFPDLDIIFTVSPVRHVRDGLHENNLSKATLLMAIDELCGKHDYCYYFPAYELLNDDLRDYRFYGSDLVHPSDSAIEYIWEKFRDTYVDPEGIRLLKEGEKLTRRLAHRPILAQGNAKSKEVNA